MDGLDTLFVQLKDKDRDTTIRVNRNTKKDIKLKQKIVIDTETIGIMQRKKSISKGVA
jgi:hypothetical protein